MLPILILIAAAIAVAVAVYFTRKATRATVTAELSGTLKHNTQQAAQILISSLTNPEETGTDTEFQ